MSAQEWVEVSRQERGLYLSPPHDGQGFNTYACIVYEVTEQLGDTLRRRTVDGEPLYIPGRDAKEMSANIRLLPIAKVLRLAMDEVGHACRALDSKRRGTT